VEFVFRCVRLSCVPNPPAYSKQAASCTFLSTSLVVVFSVYTNGSYERQVSLFCRLAIV